MEERGGHSKFTGLYQPPLVRTSDETTVLLSLRHGLVQVEHFPFIVAKANDFKIPI